MKVIRLDEVRLEEVKTEGAANTRIQWIINREHGAHNFLMRRFVLAKNGTTPLHSHAYEHEIYVLSGRGLVTDGKNEIALAKDSAVFVPAGQSHQFKNANAEDFVFLCMVPAQGVAKHTAEAAVCYR